MRLRMLLMLACIASPWARMSAQQSTVIGTITMPERAAGPLLTSIEVTPTGCWEWQKSLFASSGYAYVKHDGKGRLAHRVSYETFVGPIPEGLQIDHLCRNRPCINPDHLEPVTAAVNQQRQGSEKTHCPRGHEYTDANTYIRPGTHIRNCRRCQRKGARA